MMQELIEELKKAKREGLILTIPALPLPADNAIQVVFIQYPSPKEEQLKTVYESLVLRYRELLITPQDPYSINYSIIISKKR